MKKIFLKFESGLGLVEALIALAIVGTAMVIITQVSLNTIKIARKNELQDVAVQVAVEAMDFMKQPEDIVTDVTPHATNGSYYKLDISSDLMLQISGDPNAEEITEDHCGEESEYLVSSEGSGYENCQQIHVMPDPANPENKYDIRVIIVWQSVGGEYEKRVFKGFRVGKITVGGS